jgi:threonine dehydratase
MMSGVSLYFQENSPKTKLIGVEPDGAAKMSAALKAGKPVTLPQIDTFVDGCAVQTAGQETYRILSKSLAKILKIPEGKVCTTMIELYQKEGIIAEPAGALSISALDFMQAEIKGKKVVCILSGGNNDILRYPEIMERSLIFEGLRHYMLVKFAQKPGQLKAFLMEVLGPTDDIIRFEYIKKTNAETGPAMVGIEVAKPEHFEKLTARMKSAGINYELINNNNILFKYIV